MNRRRKAALGALLSGAAVLVTVTTANVAYAHGTMQTPASRTYTCWHEGAETPQSAACKAAVAAGGTQPVYDWNEIHLLNANGQSRALIPDGKLCSAGLDKYKGFDLARNDWPATTMPQTGSFSYTFRETAPHRGTFSLYITRDGYDPTKPLTWSALEATPFFSVTDPPLTGNFYNWTAPVPANKNGRHLIYAIWQRSDSPEAFYSCSDVVFGKDTTPPPTPGPCAPLPDWDAVTAYITGQQVGHLNHKWQAQWWTKAEEPGTTGLWGVWKDLGAC